MLKYMKQIELHDEFNSFLQDYDPKVNDKINFKIYQSRNKFNIEIFPAKEGFNSRGYFEDNFEGLTDLADFANYHRIKMITY